MKIKSMLYSVLVSAAVVTLLANCSGNKTEEHAHDSAPKEDTVQHASGSTATSDATEPQFQVDAVFQNQLANVFTSYVELKDAFVESNTSAVNDKTKQTDEALGKVDMKLLSGAAHNDWMNYLSSIQTSLKQIGNANDIELQRKAFSDLSDNLYKSIKAFGIGGKTAFYEYCPMAFSNEGAYWLSEQEQIRNPYFGSKMLGCGQVKEKLK